MTQHAVIRAQERAQVALTPADVQDLQEAVRAGRALLQADRGNAGVYLVRHDRSGRLLSVVYVHAVSRIVTVLATGRLTPRSAEHAGIGGRRAPRREAQRVRHEIQEAL